MKKSHALFAFVGLFVLLTAGTAQSLSGSNTVFSDDIVDGQVKFADIKPDAVTSSRIRTDAVGASEIRADQVGASELADNSVEGPNIIDNTVTSADITNGQVNTTDLAGGAVRASDLGIINVRTTSEAINANGGTATLTANCNAGEILISGGHSASSFLTSNVTSRPINNSWFVAYRNADANGQTVTAYALCLGT